MVQQAADKGLGPFTFLQPQGSLAFKFRYELREGAPTDDNYTCACPHVTRDLAAVYAALPPLARARIRNRLLVPICLPCDFATALAARGYGAIDAVVALASSAAPWASDAIGTVAGRPVTHCRARRPLPYAPLRTPLLVGPDARVVVGLVRNPRLPTTESFQRYALLRDGMSIHSFLKRGGTRRDVRNWEREGSLVLAEPGVAVTAASVLLAGGRA